MSANRFENSDDSNEAFACLMAFSRMMRFCRLSGFDLNEGTMMETQGPSSLDLNSFNRSSDMPSVLIGALKIKIYAHCCTKIHKHR
jgi:hypothetical protein